MFILMKLEAESTVSANEKEIEFTKSELKKSSTSKAKAKELFKELFGKEIVKRFDNEYSLEEILSDSGFDKFKKDFSLDIYDVGRTTSYKLLEI